MTKRTLIILVALTLTITVRAQLTLDSCKIMAHRNYPAIKQFGLIEQSRNYTLSNAAKAWLPQVSLTATSAWFTDIVNIPIQSAIVGHTGNSIYNGGVMINQTLFDGGAVSARKHEALANADVSLEQNNIIMYKVGNRTEQIFFGVLTLDEQIEQNHILQNNLSVAMRTVLAAERSGLANKSDIDAVSVEQIRARQAEERLKASRKAYMLMLSKLIGQNLEESTSLSKPERPRKPDNTVRRPELELYKTKDRLLDVRLKNLDSRLMPRLSTFAIAMLHNKPFGMMKGSLFAAGISLSWNIGAFYTRSNDKRLIETERSINSLNREIFLFNTELETRQTEGVVDAIEKQIKLDEEIIALRESIGTKSLIKVQNGTESVNEMIRDINAVNEAKLTKAMHELQLTQEIYRLKNIKNN